MKVTTPRILYIPILSCLSVVTMLLLPVSVHALSPVCTWTGGGGNTNWSNSSNWNCTSGTIPANGDSLAFNDSLVSGNTPTTDDIGSLQLDTITFSGNSPGNYVLGGSSTLTISGGIAANNTGGINSIGLAVTLADNLSFTGSSMLDFTGGAITIGTHTLSLGGNGGFTFMTPMVGSGTLNVGTSSSTLFSWDSPNFTGSLNISNSRLIINASNPSALGTSSVFIANGGTLQESINNSGTYTISNALSLGGIGAGPSGQLDVHDFTGSTSTLNFTGAIALVANSQVSLESANANITGPVSGCFSISTVSGSTGALSGSLTGSCASATNNTVSAPGTPDTGFGALSKTSPLETVGFLLSLGLIATGLAVLYRARIAAH